MVKGSFEESLPDLVFLSDRGLEGLPDAALLLRARQVLEALSATLRQKVIEIDKAISEATVALNGLVEELSKALKASDAQLEKEFAKLPAVAGKKGKEIGRAYQQLLREIEQIRPAETRLRTVDKLVKGIGAGSAQSARGNL